VIGVGLLVIGIWADGIGVRDATSARQPESPVAACPADYNISGLPRQLDVLAEQMAGEKDPCPAVIAENPQEPGARRDLLAVCDAAGEIRDRVRGRALLCSRLEDSQAEVTAARDVIAHKDRMLELAASTIGTYKTEWESLLNKRTAKGRGPFGFTLGACVSIPLNTVEAGQDVLFTGSGCWGYRLP